jgi:hypothetical protein
MQAGSRSCQLPVDRAELPTPFYEMAHRVPLHPVMLNGCEQAQARLEPRPSEAGNGGQASEVPMTMTAPEEHVLPPLNLFAPPACNPHIWGVRPRFQQSYLELHGSIPGVHSAFECIAALEIQTDRLTREAPTAGGPSRPSAPAAGGLPVVRAPGRSVPARSVGRSVQQQRPLHVSPRKRSSIWLPSCCRACFVARPSRARPLGLCAGGYHTRGRPVVRMCSVDHRCPPAVAALTRMHMQHMQHQHKTPGDGIVPTPSSCCPLTPCTPLQPGAHGSPPPRVTHQHSCSAAPQGSIVHVAVHELCHIRWLLLAATSGVKPK